MSNSKLFALASLATALGLLEVVFLVSLYQALYLDLSHLIEPLVVAGLLITAASAGLLALTVRSLIRGFIADLKGRGQEG